MPGNNDGLGSVHLRSNSLPATLPKQSMQNPRLDRTSRQSSSARGGLGAVGIPKLREKG